MAGKKTSEETLILPGDLTGDELVRVASGGANFATAISSIYQYIVVTNNFISLDIASFNALAVNGFLSPLTWYYITDLRTYVFAITNRIVSQDAIIEKDVPYSIVNYGAVSLWENGGIYPLNEPVVYGNFVYTSNGPINPSTIAPPDDPTNWTLQTIDSIYYRIEYLKCRFVFINEFAGYTNDYYIDQYGNESNDLSLCAYNLFNNKIDKYSYLYLYGGSKGLFYNNILRNNSVISINNQTYAEVRGNDLFNSGVSVGGEFLNFFQDNVLRNVDLNFQDGDAGEFRLNNINFEDRSIGALNIRPNQIILNKTINSQGSNLVDTLDATHAVTGSTLDLNNNGSNDAYGIFEIDVADINIDSLANDPVHFEKFIIRPKAGRVINYVTTFASFNGQLVDYSGTGGLLVGDNGDYAIIERVTVTGFNCYRITPIQQF